MQKLRRLMPVALLALVAAAPLALATCGNQYALLLTVRAQKASFLVEVFDLRIKDVATGEIVLEREGEKVDASNPNRDISEPGQELKIAVELAREGTYLVYLLGRSGAGTGGGQFYLRKRRVDGVVSAEVTLQPLVGDEDGDGYPACGPPAGVECGSTSCEYLDCDDSLASVHPFAQEVCENGLDDDCSAGCSGGPAVGDAACVDADGDGVPAGADCDDDDPCRSPDLIEAKNTCNTSDADWNAPAFSACKAALAAQGKAFSPPLCGDGVDQDCDGSDAECFVDEDCDGHSPPQDCDDTDPNVHGKAPEVCDGKDNNCDGKVDEGCIPCDVDGDQFASPDNQDPTCKLPRTDPDDYDAGVHPETTTATGGSEGGSVLGALREYCSYAKEKNGVLRHRDVDHDGDGLSAAQDGCPAESCDQDGDGFKNASCNPPKSREDCDDTDPRTFPGAPDLCTGQDPDSKAQNCVADQACSCDEDGDGYCPPGDCDDKNADIHPWAVERCDRVDNDCDGLVDEGNPDGQGNPIPTDQKLCNDDNDGKCAPQGAELSGICACSGLKPKGTRDPTNRVACADEDLSRPASPRCFGARQPELERCDQDDWNCDGEAFVSGESFAAKGQTCGTNKGSCTAGVVDDCDLSNTVAHPALVKQVLTAQGIEFNEHWVCTGALLPVPEACNNEDDDCNGSKLPGEVDVDKDTYIACSGCTKGTGRTDLKVTASLNGCGDCNDKVPSIYPGAPEACNGVDDNCQAGITDDGINECTGALSCCTSQKACRNLSNDEQNCGDCGKVCPSATTDTCSGGKCVCGSSSGPCTGDLNCSGGACKCLAGGLCKGCCDGNTCRGGTSPSDCGTGGEACQSCTAPGECRTPTCPAGSCSTSELPDGDPCSGGQCYDGSCCTGCWDGSHCQGGGTVSACGSGGADCQSCKAPECQVAGCNGTSCTTSAVPNTTPCSGGRCYGGGCCTTCWTGTSCATTISDYRCGANGGSCQNCASDDLDCVGGSCACVKGGNCAGCCDSGTCYDGTSTQRCGDGGEPCDTCSGGVCYQQSCCYGCIGNNACRTGTSQQYCGSGGEACQTCYTANECKVADCSTGSCDISNVSNNTPCTGGKCINGVCTASTPDAGVDGS